MSGTSDIDGNDQLRSSFLPVEAAGPSILSREWNPWRAWSENSLMLRKKSDLLLPAPADFVADFTGASLVFLWECDILACVALLEFIYRNKGC